MTEFTLHTEHTAPDKSKPFLQAAKSAYGFVPNLIGTMGSSPSLVEGYMALAGIFDKTELTETERQIILMTNNRLNGCVYCMAAHTTISQMHHVSTDVIEALRSGTEISDPKLEALRIFTTNINESRGWPTENQVATFIAAGYTQQSVLDVILGTSLKVMSNYTNHIAETALDEPFSSNAWSES